VTIFPIIVLSIVVGLSRYITKSWISPGTFFPLCWTFFLLVPIVFAPDYKVDHLAIWFISIFSMSVSAGGIMAYPIGSIDQKQLKHSEIYSNIQFLFYILISFIFVSFIGLYFLSKYASNLYHSNNYINNWMMIPNMLAVDRYSGTLNYPFYIKYSLYLIYPGTLLGGLLFGYKSSLKKIKVRFFSLLPLFQALLLGIIEGARTSILLGLILFASGWLSTFMINHTQLINKKRSFLQFILGAGFFILIFTFFFILIQWLRQGMDTIIIDLLIERIRAYFFGYLAAFSQWFGGDIASNANLGLITFAGPFNLFGIMERPLGFYDAINISKDISTNIFTAFRGIVTDFTISGSIVIAFIIGFIIQTIYQKNEKTTLLSCLPISMFYAFTLYSPLISVFHFNSIFFSWLILLIILIFAVYEPVDNYS